MPPKEILNDIQYGAFIVFVVSLIFSESIKLIILYGVMIPVFFIQLYRRDIGIRLGLLEYGFIAFVLTSVLSGLFASNIPEYIKGMKDVTRIAVLFFISAAFSGQRRITTVLWCLYAATAAMAVFGVYEAVKFHKPLDLHMLGHYNYTAMYLGIISNALIGTIVFSEIRTKAMKAAAVMLLFITITATVMTTMRAAFVTLFIFSAIVVFTKRKSLVSKAIAAGFAAFALAAAYVFKPMWTKLSSGESLIRRLYIWKYALKIITETRALGAGLNNFKYTFPAAIEGGRTIYDAHSLYLNTAVQSGVAGLCSVFAIGIGFVRRWFSITGGAFEEEIRYAALGAALVIFVGGIFDTTLHHETGMLFAILTGFMAGLPSAEPVRGTTDAR
ncbi:O-antigen ligase family protein [Candidatus Magnetominusculus xianensis]|uniref:O-antigen ligase family protein n=1 Tax=Candidatus Magnetominusculus xianensis TaxID=1748249 RepID=UPI0019DF93A0|nr:O-antigen ligase family protein [Candidatus Magnetominusculus xianensis]MBF0404508.1 O-antigen ligase family protein [Nitrospirota bacterium]